MTHMEAAIITGWIESLKREANAAEWTADEAKKWAAKVDEMLNYLRSLGVREWMVCRLLNGLLYDPYREADLAWGQIMNWYVKEDTHEASAGGDDAARSV